MPIRFFAAAGLAALLTGCATVGPEFKAPAAPTVASFAMAGDAAPMIDTAAHPAGAWWTAFGSPQLDAVIAQALKDNPTLAEANATLERSQQDYNVLDDLRTPQVDGTAGVSHQRINIKSFGFAGGPLANIENPTTTLYSVGASVSYDLDLFGGGRRGREAGRARIEENARKADAAYLTLTGQVAMQAVRIAALRAQIDAAQAVIADGQRTVDIAKRAEEAGSEAPASLSPSVAQLAADRAQIPPLQAQLAQARHALALLVGQPPGGWTAPDFDLAAFKLPAQVPVSVPSELVRRRPDILAAEAALHAATADIGVQTAKLYPDLKLNAGFNQGALDVGKIFSYDSTGWNIGPQVVLPIIDGGRRKATVAAAQADARAADARYRQTVLTAFAQVADALDALGRDDAEIKAVGDQVASAQQSFNDSQKAYDLGGGTLLSVVDAQRQLSRSRRDLVRVQGDRYAHVVVLFTAVAADWRPSLSVSDASSETGEKARL